MKVISDVKMSDIIKRLLKRSAPALVDKTYPQFPVKANYGADPIPTLNDNSVLAVWQYAAGAEGTELELRGLTPWVLVQYLKSHFSTDGGGGSAGMVREFSASPNSREYATSGNASKIYTVTIGVPNSEYRATCIVDYQDLSSNGSRVYTIPLQQDETSELGVYKLRATLLTSGATRVNFTLEPPAAGFWEGDLFVMMTQICGYY